MGRRELYSRDFTVIGPWRITQGQAWRKWRGEALRACQCGAAAVGDDVTARRFQREIEDLERQPLDPPGGSARRDGR